MMSDPSIQELYDKLNSAKNSALSLLTDTIWPSESKTAVDALKQSMNNLPNFPTNASTTTFKDPYVDFIHVLERAYTRIKNASENYGKEQRGPFGALKAKLSSGHRRRCTDTLWGCRAEIEKGLATLRSQQSCLGEVPATGPVQDPNTPSELQPRSTTARLEANRPTKPSEAPPISRTEAAGQTVASEHPTSQPATLQDSSSGPAEDSEYHTSIRDRVFTVAKKTFKIVDTGSGAIPVVGNFVGVAAKVGLAFVDMIETMDSNEDVCKELTSHTEELSSHLEHFKKKVNTETGDQIAARIEKLRHELERVQVKVNKWNSSGVFQKLLLSGDHAEEFKASQETVQTTLDRMQLLVSLKTNHIVVDLNDNVLRAERTRLLDRLGDGSYGARGGSIEEVTCLRGTRVELLNRIDVWIKDTSTSAQRVLWIRGMAGRGKSAIASTVAHNWSSKGSCAIFHFRRGQHAQDDRFICALARQLGKALVPEVKNAILECVKENEDIATERLEQQFKTIFVGSLGNAQADAHPIVIVVDALDECQNVNDAVRFVRLLDQHCSLLPANIKFLLTCRPETPLTAALEPRAWHSEDLDSASHISAADIALFLEHACTQIRNDGDLPKTWPSPAEFKGMVEMSQGLFQWARTAIAFIGDGSPEHRLRELLQHPSRWRGLDDLYRQILSRAFDKVDKDPEREQLLSWVLGTVVVAPHPITLEIIAFLYADHEVFKGQDRIIQFLRKDILADLNSLLHIPTSPSEPMRLMHTSIRDLLAAQGRSEKRYFVNAIQDHCRLAAISLDIMQRDLKQNICNLARVPNANSDILDAVNLSVVSGLRYCCRSWSTHLVSGVSSSEATGDTKRTVIDKFKLFSDEKLLSWLEVMSLIGAMSEAYTVAKQVQQWLLEWPMDVPAGSLKTLWSDTQRFITAFFVSISSNALHIYASGLPRCPVETELWLKYRGQATAWFLQGKERNWSANLWTASAVDRVHEVAFSPDGGTVASGSGGSHGGNVVQLWDAQTGASLGDPLTGHSDRVRSVVFSPDGRVLATGSDDKTLRLWDVQTGAPWGEPLTGHSDSIWSVVFSPDGNVMASGSKDKTVRFWDTQTGAPLGDPLTGHSSFITSVVFSPDRKVLASGSWDMKIRLWDVQTGAPLGDPLIGHKSPIECVVFSPDGKVLASGSWHESIRLWDVKTGAPLGEPLTGHASGIKAVVFSPCGKVLASGSSDQTVRLWDAQTGAPLADPLTGHSSFIESVVFSPDGKVLASGSYDGTVRLWDARTRTQLGDPPTGHKQEIGGVALSPDGKVLASGGADSKIQLWDAQTGAPLGDPLTGHDMQIECVAFSPEGKVLASVSLDQTIRLWDTQTGAPLGDPLTDHEMEIVCFAFSPDGKILACGGCDPTIRLWDVQTGAPLGDPLTGHTTAIPSVVFSPDGKVLASGSEDKTVRLWDVRTRTPLREPLGHSESIWSVVFSPDGKVLASGSNKVVRLWDTQTGAPLGDPLTGHSDSIRSVVFSPDGNVLASGSNDKTVRFWDAQTGAPLGDPLTGHTSTILSVLFSPCGKVMFSVSRDDGMVRFWECNTFKSLTVPQLSDILTCSHQTD